MHQGIKKMKERKKGKAEESDDDYDYYEGFDEDDNRIIDEE